MSKRNFYIPFVLTALVLSAVPLAGCTVRPRGQTLQAEEPAAQPSHGDEALRINNLIDESGAFLENNMSAKAVAAAEEAVRLTSGSTGTGSVDNGLISRAHDALGMSLLIKVQEAVSSGNGKLADGYRRRALASFSKALAMDPDNKSAAENLQSFRNDVFNPPAGRQ